MQLWKIFLLFAKMGVFTFGGGYAMLPILKSEMVDKRKLINEEELLNYYSIGQCTPGLIAVNAASFIGYKLRKLSGLIAATLGVISPSILVIVLVAMFLHKYMDNQYVIYAFGGIRISVVALIVNVVIDLWKSGMKNVEDYIIFVVAVGLLFFLNLSAVAVVLLVIGSSLLAKRLGK